MTAQHPIIKYRLTPDGRIPSYLCKHPDAFAGMYGVNTNKPGYIPRWPSPMETQYLGMACGPADPDGCPACIEIVETKQELQDYITEISIDWIVDSEGVTATWTETTTGSLEAWNPPSLETEDEDYVAPTLDVTTTEKTLSDAPAGTIIEHTAEYVTKIEVETSSSAGTTTSVQEFDIVHPYTNITITGTTESVEVVTTSGYDVVLDAPEEITITTTTTKTQATHQDITESYSDSFTTTDVDGEVTKTRVRTYTETTRVRNPFDPVAATDELWTKYETVNNL